MNKLLPFMSWAEAIRDPHTLRADLIAGVTVALILIPQSMAYAQLAGLPPYFGLYAAFLPGIIAALWGSSKQLATGPVAVVSLLTASALIPLMSGATPESMSPEELLSRYAPLAILLAFLVGAFQLLLGLLRLGMVVNLLSHPVIIGFTQLSKLFGVPMERSSNFLSDLWGVVLQADQAHIITLLIGLSAFAIMWGFKKYRPNYPCVLIAVVCTTLVSYLIGFQQLGGDVVGEVPAGLPSLTLPPFEPERIASLLPHAIAISLVGFMEAISIAKAIAAKTKEPIDPNQELIGQGLGNLFGSFSQAYPTSGSFSRSAVNLGSGAVTGMSSIFTGLTVLITLLFLTPLLYHLPQAALAAVIMMAVVNLLNFKAVIRIWRASRDDGIASVITFIATLGFAPHLDLGILVGVGLATGMLLYRAMRPHIVFLGHHADGSLRDPDLHADLSIDEHLVVLRYDGSLVFVNATYFEEAILDACANNPEAQYIVVVSNGINQLDASGEEVVRHLVSQLRENGVTLIFSGLKRQVLALMQQTELISHIGRDNIHPTEERALKSIYARLEAESQLRK